MTKILRTGFSLMLLLGLAVTLAGCGGIKPGNARAMQPLPSSTVSQLAIMGSSPGEGTLIRIFKESSELELWKRTTAGSYKLFRTYEICAWSGGLGPKVKEGDRQSPEGFYNITPGLMNPNSNYYLAFNTGFPNKFDRAWGRNGSNLMVHGDCSSRGCYSMTDASIAEIYALVRESFVGGNPIVQLQIFPFRMTPHNLAKHASDPNLPFWKDIKEGYDRFELSKQPPAWDVCNREYVFDVPHSGASVLSAVDACPARTGDTTLMAALQQKQAADDAAIAAEVASIADRDTRAKVDAERKAAEEVALKARSEAIGGFIGGIVGGVVGGVKDLGVQKVVDPTIEAPVPAARIKRG